MENADFDVQMKMSEFRLETNTSTETSKWPVPQKGCKTL